MFDEILDFMMMEASFGYNCGACGDLILPYEDDSNYTSGDIIQIQCCKCGTINNVEIE